MRFVFTLVAATLIGLTLRFQGAPDWAATMFTIAFCGVMGYLAGRDTKKG